MRIFLDANVLFSAAKSEGAVRELLRQLVARQHVLCADAYVLAEAARNLEQKNPEALDAFEALLRGVEVSPFVAGDVSKAAGQLLPDKDRPVLAAAVRLHCEVLLTGDRTHLGALYGSRIDGVTVASPRLLAELLLG